MEGMAPPPLGNLDFGAARNRLGSGFVIQGGMTCHEEELTGTDVRQRIFARDETLFQTLPDKRAFVFGSGCCPGPKARSENLLALRDACHCYG
jgi:hypothetical protein